MLALSGTLDRLHLGDLLEWLHLTKATGRLQLSAASVTRSFDIVRGKVAFASSSRAAERLGSWLLRKGLASRGALMRALAIAQTRGESFTEVAEREANVSHPTLVEAGRSLATALASRVMREERVAFRFDPSWPVTERLHVDLQLQCSKLMMQAAYSIDTRPPGDVLVSARAASLDPDTIERLYWQVVEELTEEPIEGHEFGAAHRTLVAVGDLLHRWVTQGPPLLPVPAAEVERVAQRLARPGPVLLEDSPTLTWDLLSLVNGLDAPELPRAASAQQAWELAGHDAPLLVHLLLDNARWRRHVRGESDEALHRVCCARTAAARLLGAHLGMDVETAATAVALQMVLLEFIATALATTPLASVEMQRAALRSLLPVVGQAAGVAAGLPEVLLAALAGTPADHPGSQLAGLVALATEQGGDSVYPGAPPGETSDPRLAHAVIEARAAAARAADAAAE